MEKILFLDLDGTIIDPRERYYILHKEICSRFSVSPLSMVEYWNQKRKSKPEADILMQCGAQISNLENVLGDRVSKLEDSLYLKHDRVHDGLIDFLERFSKTHKLVLVTYRKNRKELIRQLLDLDIKKYFYKVLNTSQKENIKFMGKVNIISQNFDDEQYVGVFIGDTEVDMLAGKFMKMTTVAFLNGIRERSILEKNYPNFYIDSWNVEDWNSGLKEMIGLK